MRPTTAISGIRTVSVRVADQDAALGFYIDTLGFEPRLDVRIDATRRWVEVAPPGAAASLALEAAQGNAAPATTDTGIRFAVADAASEHGALRARGVRVAELLRWDGIPPMFAFDDPDGNRFYIVEDRR